ncbi:unnamed protein product [Mytilus edulis]|uniref:Novel STAND NTPase 3 domain-containing protein n=1 Tax=Mytilus edulis TaxID=6550 RepID=A0A8S3V5L3_MYTED|nr:unnamed protein product [Mytilus edulis]
MLMKKTIELPKKTKTKSCEQGKEILIGPEKLLCDLIDLASTIECGWPSETLESGTIVQNKLQKALKFVIRSDIRNPWAHCDFTEWTATKYTDSFQLMGQLISNLRLSNREENRILAELNRWAMNGQHFLSGTTLGLEIVGDIRQQTHVLSRYVQTLCTESDSQFIKVQKELSRIENDLQGRIKSLESLTMDKEIGEWEQDQATFFETRATRHILESLPFHNCIIVTGSSGCGKSSNIHHASLHLRDSFGYEIIPVLTGTTDIMHYYNENKKQVFVVDDICGKKQSICRRYRRGEIIQKN